MTEKQKNEDVGGEIEKEKREVGGEKEEGKRGSRREIVWTSEIGMQRCEYRNTYK